MVRFVASAWRMKTSAPAAGTPLIQLVATVQLPLPLKVQELFTACVTAGIDASAAPISHFLPRYEDLRDRIDSPHSVKLRRPIVPCPEACRLYFPKICVAGRESGNSG